MTSSAKFLLTGLLITGLLLSNFVDSTRPPSLGPFRISARGPSYGRVEGSTVFTDIDQDLTQGSSLGVTRVTLREAAINKGAVCLDGSPPVYYYRLGSGEGSSRWIIFHQGGAWCYDLELCAQRTRTYLGSTTMEGSFSVEDQFLGMMGQDPIINPDFYNWNHVFVRYCDGASFSGNLDAPVEVSSKGQAIFFRGQRIWEAVIKDLLENQGMKSAEKALLAGCSAGGLTTLIHCDQFRQIMPPTTDVKCLSDAGFFLDQMNVDGVYFFRGQISSAVALQNVTTSLHPDCVSQRATAEVWQCFFPQNFIQYVRTPIYILNSGYDYWQISSIILPVHDWKDVNGTWHACYRSFSSCSRGQLAILLDFRNKMVSIINPVMANILDKSGAFIISAKIHCAGNLLWHTSWNEGGGLQIESMTPAEAFGDWYFERNKFPRIQIQSPLPAKVF